MTLIPGINAHNMIQVVPSSELAIAPTLTVKIGDAPDGLPWLLRVDRSQRITGLFSAVINSFGVGSIEDLPEGVRNALTNDVAAGLMGVHQVELEDGNEEVFVSRRDVHSLFGPTLLSRALDSSSGIISSEIVDDDHRAMSRSYAFCEASNAIMGGDELLEQVEQAIIDRESKRHLLLQLKDGLPYIGTVSKENRALRKTHGPYRRTCFESLFALEGARATVEIPRGEKWHVPLNKQVEYQSTLLRASQSSFGGVVQFEVPKSVLLNLLIQVLHKLDETHQDGKIHGDVTPANILIDKGQARPFDGLNLPIGALAPGATFEWAAPEQVVGRPLDPSTDIYAVTRMITALLGGVPFGEESSYVVATGGQGSKKVPVLKTDGVFIDILETDYDRDWQRNWQQILKRGLAYNQEQRPQSAIEFAKELKEVAAEFPVEGYAELSGGFGQLTRLKTQDDWAFAYEIVD
ncbi:MAG: hypothetical protein P1V97_28670 [Planctomycetota bacterium]|nr:hypothetical protein [Planctomycetota bacterium]